MIEISLDIPNGTNTLVLPVVSCSTLGGGRVTLTGDPVWEGGGHVRDGDVAGHSEPGERLHSPSPDGKSWIDRGEAPFVRSAARGGVSVGLQRQATWRASIVPPGPSCFIGRTAEICTENYVVFSRLASATVVRCRTLLL